MKNCGLNLYIELILRGNHVWNVSQGVIQDKHPVRQIRYVDKQMCAAVFHCCYSCTCYLLMQLWELVFVFMFLFKLKVLLTVWNQLTTAGRT